MDCVIGYLSVKKIEELAKTIFLQLRGSLKWESK